jgi:hypothetical protein
MRDWLDAGVCVKMDVGLLEVTSAQWCNLFQRL